MLLARRLLTLVLLAVLGFAGWLVWYVTSSTDRAAYPLEFSLAAGSSLKSTAAQLHDLGVIEFPFAFTLLGRMTGNAGRIKAGAYLLSKPVSPWELLRQLTLGETLLGKITLVEGWTFRQIRAALDAHPRLRHDTSGMSDAEILAAVGSSATHPEGLFFPDTYYFDSASSDILLLHRAYATMDKVLAQAWQERAADLPYANPYQALTMASIVEKETGAAEERPLIASVFVNRLRIGMRLQTDPTVVYGLGERYDGNLRKNDLLTDTPYNTYTRAGLPPTPIAMPGREALRATLNPAQSRAMYFVAKGNGQHQFSATLDEHNRAVARYQRRQR